MQAAIPAWGRSQVPQAALRYLDACKATLCKQVRRDRTSHTSGRLLGAGWTANEGPAAMEPLRQSRDGKENDGMTAAAQQQPSPGCRPSPAASPAASDGSSTRKRPALGGHPEVSPLADPMRKRHRPGSPASTSNSPAAERDSSAEAAARRQLAALSSPSGRPGGGAAQVGACVRNVCLASSLQSACLDRPTLIQNQRSSITHPPHPHPVGRCSPAAAQKSSKHQPALLPLRRRRHLRRRPTGGSTGRCSR